MEQHLNQITVGFDFSVGGQAALAAALELARRVSATLTVVTAAPGALDKQVVDYLKRRPSKGDALEVEATFLERIERLVRAEIEANFELEGVSVRYDVGEEYASKKILQTSRNVRADMIVLGAVGNRPPKQDHTVGTDVQRIIRASAAPVLVVRPGKPFPPRRILCAVDFSEASERALGWAFDLARLFGATVDVLHVLARDSSHLNEVFGRVYPTGYAEAERTLAQQTMDDFVQALNAHDVDWRFRLAEGIPSRTVTDFQATHDFDLLTIGTLGRSAIVEALVGGTAERVIRQSTSSVLAVKPDTFVLKHS